MHNSLWYTLFALLALALMTMAQEEFNAGEPDMEASASNMATSLGIDGNLLYEDIMRIRDQVIPIADEYNH